MGTLTYKRDVEKFVSSCSCGTVGLHKSKPTTTTCEGCGNTNFINLSVNNRVVHPYIDVIWKNARGFKVKRTNLSVKLDEEFNIILKPNMVQVLWYDMSNRTVQMWKNGEKVKFLYSRIQDNDAYKRFFTGVDDVKFKNMVSVAQTESLYDMAWNELSRGRSWNDKRIYRGLIKVFDYTYLQILSNAGYPNVERFKVNNRGYYTDKTINTDGKNPKDIFGLPKFCLKHIREDENIRTYEVKQMQQALQKVDGNRFKELLEIVKDEASVRELCNSLDTLVEIHDTYKYNNLKKLTLYIFREIRMTQGIMNASTGATLLRDYIKMATKLGQEYEKYPKSLKKEHDITQMNYKVKESEMKQREFKETVTSEEYKHFEWKKKEFAIISPTEMNDLIKEGNELSHCVASYVESINTKRCRIYFMRNTEDLTKPLATVEVRGNNVRQCRGYANRALRQSEREFVAEWAKKKELELNYYY